jgi:hypothetical protein
VNVDGRTRTAVAKIRGQPHDGINRRTATASLFNHLVGAGEQRERDAETERLCDLNVRQRAGYVSSAGRIFIRSNNRSKGGQLNAERGPEEKVAGSLKFQGNSLVGYGGHEGGAWQILVTFDSGFSNCTANVVWGKSGHTQKWIGYDGVTYEILSGSITGSKCSIQEGNAFAS